VTAGVRSGAGIWWLCWRSEPAHWAAGRGGARGGRGQRRSAVADDASRRGSVVSLAYVLVIATGGGLHEASRWVAIWA